MAIEGKLQVRSYEGKDGTKKSSTEIIVDELQMLDSKLFQDGEKAKEGN